MGSEKNGDSSADETESLLNQSEDEFALTKLLRMVNGKLKDCIAGIMQRAYRVFRGVFVFVKDLLVRLFVDGIPWLLRQIWNVIKFVFGRKMYHLVEENLILIVLFPLFVIALSWPLIVYYYVCPTRYWWWIGWAWLLFISIAGAWMGFKTGLYAKWRIRWKKRRMSKKTLDEQGCA